MEEEPKTPNKIAQIWNKIQESELYFTLKLHPNPTIITTKKRSLQKQTA